MIRKIIIALLLGIVVAVSLLQEDTWIKQSCNEYLTNYFATTIGAEFVGAVERVNFFDPSCQCVDVVVKPLNQDGWQWRADRLTVRFSWLHLLMERCVDLRVTLEGLVAYSERAGDGVAITNHIRAYFKGGGAAIPTIVKSIVLTPASLVVRDVNTQGACSLVWHSESVLIDGVIKTKIDCVDGSMCVNGTDYAHSVAGSIGFQIPLWGSLAGPAGQIHLGFVNAYNAASEDTYLLTGTWADSRGSATLRNREHSCVIHADGMHWVDNDMHMEIDAAVLLSDLCTHMKVDGLATGTATLNAAIVANSSAIQSAHGSLAVRDGFLPGQQTPLPDINLSFKKDESVWRGMYDLSYRDQLNGQGSWAWDEHARVARGDFELTQDWQIPGIPHWFIPAQHAHLKLTQNEPHSFSGTYAASVVHDKSGERVAIEGVLSGGAHGITASGHVNDNAYTVKGSLAAPYVTQCQWVDGHGHKQIDLRVSPTDPSALTGTIAVDLINTVATQFLGQHVQAEGAVNVNVHCGDTIRARMQLSHGVVRIPHLYNVINGFDVVFNYDPSTKQMDVANMRCQFDRGSITCSRGTLFFNADYELAFAHVPIAIRECLFNVNKDLFALVSGHVICTKRKDTMPHVKGAFIIERSQLKENIFSDLFQKNLFQFTEKTLTVSGADVACDLSVETAMPIRIQTDFLETNARVALLVTNTIREPVLSGSVHFGSGSLHFPYKPLHISKGSLYFSPNQPYDPVIELVAKNKIKKYNITLHVTGSLRNHHIMLESTPPLTEEQIIALLLIGSQEESLNIVMPALIMSNLKSLIFGNTQSRDSLDGYFNRLFKPLSKIHLVPSFTDQTGRGGLRGAIEVDISDRWHALIQKNFSLTEDTRVEVEYELSDDITVRGIRNERRDVGGEVEMRWKF